MTNGLSLLQGRLHWLHLECEGGRDRESVWLPKAHPLKLSPRSFTSGPRERLWVATKRPLAF